MWQEFLLTAEGVSYPYTSFWIKKKKNHHFYLDIYQASNLPFQSWNCLLFLETPFEGGEHSECQGSKPFLPAATEESSGFLVRSSGPEITCP